MNLTKILNNKDVRAGKIGFRTKDDSGMYYMIAKNRLGDIIQGHSEYGVLFGITPLVDQLAGEWELYTPESTDK